MESLNKLAIRACSRAPSISLPLLDARVALERELHLGERGAKDIKWSSVQERAETMVSQAGGRRNNLGPPGARSNSSSPPAPA
eukprot:5596135-Pyramimonas_sp.AAC.2